MGGHRGIDKAPVAADTETRGTVLEDMKWHGVYQDLLFQRGTINPPCSYRKNAFSSDALAVESGTLDWVPRAAPGNPIAAPQNVQLPTSVAAFVQDFLSDSAKARRRDKSLLYIPYVSQMGPSSTAA